MVKTTKVKLLSVTGALLLTSTALVVSLIGAEGKEENNSEWNNEVYGQADRTQIVLGENLSRNVIAYHNSRPDSELIAHKFAQEEDRVRREKQVIAHIEQRKAQEERAKRLEEQRLAREKEREEERKKQVASRSSEYKGANEDIGTFNVSWYTAKCEGCTGQTATGVWVDKTIYHQGYGVAASDWRVIPPHSIIEVEGYGKFIVLDKGGAIKGSKLDLLTNAKSKAYENGRQHLNVKVLRWGKEKE